MAETIMRLRGSGRAQAALGGRRTRGWVRDIAPPSTKKIDPQKAK